MSDAEASKPGPKPKLVWIVTPAHGLHQVASSAVDGAISNGKGRRATARDLAIAGVPGADTQAHEGEA